MCVYAATLRGASQVFAVDSVRARLDKAASLGAIPIDFTSEEDGPASAQILRRRPEGIKRAVDCVGFEAVNHRLKPQQNYVINECIRVASVGGGIGQVGVYMASPTSKGVPRGGEVDPVYEINLSEAWPKSLSIKMGVCPIYELLPRLFELVRTGRARLGWLVSATMGIEDAPTAYERFEKKLETKVVFRFPWAHGGNWDVAAAVKADEEEHGVTNGIGKNGHRSEIPIPKKKLPV
jgi:threonine dehydrogenase-like Zn-dependent dehydrogenase